MDLHGALSSVDMRDFTVILWWSAETLEPYSTGVQMALDNFTSQYLSHTESVGLTLDKLTSRFVAPLS